MPTASENGAEAPAPNPGVQPQTAAPAFEATPVDPTPIPTPQTNTPVASQQAPAQVTPQPTPEPQQPSPAPMMPQQAAPAQQPQTPMSTPPGNNASGHLSGAQPTDPIAEAPHLVWYVRPPSGGEFGPANGEIMSRWVAEGRVTPDTLVWREGWAEWQVAKLVFPSL